MFRRIGLTMRASAANGGAIVRDVLAEEWPDAMMRALGAAASWMAIPSLGDRIEIFLREHAIEAVVLTGGEDVGSHPIRDATERRILDLCARERFPVLGVCRGLQLAQVHFGGRLDRAAEAHDAGRLHEIEATSAVGRDLLGAAAAVVPSFHRFGVRASALSPELDAWATSADGLVEGLSHRSAPFIAVQWHPERAMPDPGVGDRLLRGFADGWADGC